MWAKFRNFTIAKNKKGLYNDKTVLSVIKLNPILIKELQFGMANNMKSKKNKKSYDNKVITWISVGLAAFVIVVVAIVLIVTLTT